MSGGILEVRGGEGKRAGGGVNLGHRHMADVMGYRRIEKGGRGGCYWGVGLACMIHSLHI